MSRVEINADGRHVVVDAEGELDDLAKTAISLWEHAESYRSPGPAFGLTSGDLRWTPEARSSSMRSPADAREELP